MKALIKLCYALSEDDMFVLAIEAITLLVICACIYLALALPYVTGAEELSYYQQYGGENQ